MDASLPASHDHPGGTGRERISVLVVEDQELVAELLAAALEDVEDIDVGGVATTVADALRLAAELRPDVVLMDFALPDGDGVAATAGIREARPETKVVMLTSSQDESVLARAIDAGCSGFLTKSRTVEDVTAAVRAAHAGEALITPEMLARLLPRLQRGYQGIGSDLTKREVEVLDLLADGAATADIARHLGVRVNTVRNHVQRVLQKLNAHSKLEAVAVATREGLITRHPT